jgi:hypothetical protein
MAQRPTGERRAWPNLEDETFRRRELKRQIIDAIGEGLPPAPFKPVTNGVASRFPGPATSSSTVLANGRAACVTPARYSLAELAEQRQAIERALFMASAPIAGASYGAAAMAGASPAARDRALMAGAIADTALLGVAPRAALPRSQPPAPRSPVLRTGPRTDLGRRTNAQGQVTSAVAELTKGDLRFGRRPDRRIKPPGWQGDGREHKESRGHVIAGSLGGPHDQWDNFVTLTQKPTNSPQMSGFEREVARRLRGGEAIEYRVTPLYRTGALPPSHLLLTAHGPREGFAARVIGNPAGRRR